MILLRLGMYSIQSYFGEKFIDIQKNGWRKRNRNSSKEKGMEDSLLAENSGTANSSPAVAEEIEDLPLTGEKKKQQESIETEKDMESKNVDIEKELKTVLEYPTREERERCFWNRFWNRERNKTDVSELMRRKKAFSRIEVINLDILQWFCDKWLSDINKSDVGKDTKLEFYLWLEANYMEHLIEHQKHKKGHFAIALSLIKKEAKLQGIQKALDYLVKIGVWIFSIFSIANVDVILRGIKEIIQLKTFSAEVKIVVVIGVAMVIVCSGWSFFRLLARAEYGRQKNAVTDNKGTWLRHQEAIVGYQKEMLEYIWNIGDYGGCLLNINRDRLLMSNMKEVWDRNAKKFQENMSR